MFISIIGDTSTISSRGTVDVSTGDCHVANKAQKEELPKQIVSTKKQT